MNKQQHKSIPALLTLAIVLILNGCSTKEAKPRVITVTKQKFINSTIYVPEDQFTTEKSTKIPKITSDISKKNLEKINNLIIDLYLEKNECKQKLKNIHIIIKNFNERGK